MLHLDFKKTFDHCNKFWTYLVTDFNGIATKLITLVSSHIITITILQKQFLKEKVVVVVVPSGPLDFLSKRYRVLLSLSHFCFVISYFPQPCRSGPSIAFCFAWYASSNAMGCSGFPLESSWFQTHLFCIQDYIFKTKIQTLPEPRHQNYYKTSIHVSWIFLLPTTKIHNSPNLSRYSNCPFLGFCIVLTRADT